MPSHQPSKMPSSIPSVNPSDDPSSNPSKNPSNAPSFVPTELPSETPSQFPTLIPSSAPTGEPTYTVAPSVLPSQFPSAQPSITMQPSMRCNMDRTMRNDLTTKVIASKSIELQRQASFQQAALEWLLEKDQFYVCPYDGNTVQRYAAATLLMSLGKSNMLSSRHECQWDGIKCNHDGSIKYIDICK